MKKQDLPYTGVFWAVVMLLFVVLGWRAWQLSPLLVQPDVRGTVEQAMRALERDRGWLLSDISVRRVTSEDMRIVYRPHLRGRDPRECYIVPFSSFAPQPCDKDL